MRSRSINQERAMQIILAPQISEKATLIAEKNNQYIFRVLPDAAKDEIKAAIEYLWKSQKIEVTKVQISNIKGKEKRFGKFLGKRSNWKKAYVGVKKGQELSFSDLKQGDDK
ncbi:LSU ribosomal protein L23P [Nitrosomonas nitrosa]|jgi:large subunit ribosomal protein L23|uniref:Large ribosomal subunit protein uL23 n=1 Tax=Nitrosomonas nitrosa TaxID=52442 RepID=A0A1I4QR97_9PROT|nr:50S ribosomal protein L23 [Nitrosomonas nitrosa]PTR03612.1 LSU ribosomal protein L23P [Nitrosomonas nitrosa]CAE6501394.1 50S ribosomal subunit protein L23 [Nitrosomonas nitrosa]SFM42226.1 LSU ribosomal protein L23P [Nitrosomonas nitrosa]